VSKSSRRSIAAPRVLILDEPTGVLTPAEADHLFRILKQLKSEGKTILLITHKLREIMAVTDEVSVMRRGEMVATRTTAEHLGGGTGRADGRAQRACCGSTRGPADPRRRHALESKT
jgi:ABC-type multidrug transport system ATPase subunit